MGGARQKRTTVVKWGRSLAIRIPKAIAERVNLRPGTPVVLDTTGGVLTVTTKRRRKYTLAELLAKARGPFPHGAPVSTSRRPIGQLVKGMNRAAYRRHGLALDDDGPVGREIW